jgi:hypothetical protein
MISFLKKVTRISGGTIEVEKTAGTRSMTDAEEKAFDAVFDEIDKSREHMNNAFMNMQDLFKDK